MARPIWSGAISFGLVSIPCKVVSAIGSEHAVKFHQMHRTDQGRVRYRKVCELDGQELAQDEIVRGYTAPDGRVAVIRDQELEDLPLPTAHTVEVSGFIPVQDVALVRWGKPYYLTPDKSGVKPYVLMREALRRSGKAAVAKVAMRGREQLVLVRVHEDVLVMQQIHWPDEVNSPTRIAPSDRVTVTDAELDAADALIDALGPVDLDAMEDEYQRAVDQLVTARLEGEQPPEGEPEREAAPAMDLMAALRASVADATRQREEGTAPKGAGGKKSTATKTAKTTTEASPKKTTATKSTAAKKTATSRGGGRRAS
ncbi:Ku protein [Streptodolium elevatio]|uniref:Non-homologous end joining protein Ku n=1 Tax=Streptodolium elevatio TaxID=3157996 RepID=A0ABV3DSA1_9ACTN